MKGAVDFNPEGKNPAINVKSLLGKVFVSAEPPPASFEDLGFVSGYCIRGAVPPRGFRLQGLEFLLALVAFCHRRDLRSSRPLRGPSAVLLPALRADRRNHEPRLLLWQVCCLCDDIGQRGLGKTDFQSASFSLPQGPRAPFPVSRPGPDFEVQGRPSRKPRRADKDRHCRGLQWRRNAQARGHLGAVFQPTPLRRLRG